MEGHKTELSLEPDERELKKIRKNMARAYKELMELAPIIEGKKYRKGLDIPKTSTYDERQKTEMDKADYEELEDVEIMETEMEESEF